MKSKVSSSLLIAAIFILFGTISSFVFSYELWPLSRYDMYSTTMPNSSYYSQRFYGVSQDGREWPLDERYFFFLLGYRDRLVSIKLMLGRSQDDPERAHRVLNDLMALYNQRIEQRQIRGTPIIGLRLYAVRWEMRIPPSNYNLPDGRRLLYEVFQP